MAKHSRTKKPNSERKGSVAYAFHLFLAFILGTAFAATILVHYRFFQIADDEYNYRVATSALPLNYAVKAVNTQTKQAEPFVRSDLDGLGILVAIAAYDFSQMPHLEEVLDAYFDLCAAGSKVDVVVYSTIPWPVTLIDMLNTRFVCTNPSPQSGFSVTVHLKDPSVKLRLVDFHRPLFYDNLEKYDLFIYSEDDIRVSPKTVAAYMSETLAIKRLLGPENSANYNVGVARYEYNYPPDIVIDDKTRHATQNVTRVYWEHSWHPTMPNSVDEIPRNELLPRNYVHMKNHHQGMYLATRELLTVWRERTGCEFDQMKKRPGLKNKPSQPAEGTQRVWMSSQQLYGKNHCGVQQLIPADKFGEFTVLHLPNKNYRRFGRKGRMGGHMENAKEKDDATPVKIEGPSTDLLGALELHLLIRKQLPQIASQPYLGIRMEDHVDGRAAYSEVFKRRMQEYYDYVERGGILDEGDFLHTNLVEDD